jgi:hypothetical protein
MYNKKKGKKKSTCTDMDPVKSSENVSHEYAINVNFGASMILLLVGPALSYTYNLSWKGAFSITIS